MKNNMNHSPKAILEPTCGVGNFLSAASSTFSGIDVFGIDINQDYVWRARKAVPNATIVVGNIFGLDTRRMMSLLLEIHRGQQIPICLLICRKK